ncbi:MAG: PDZ domain-containing protein [Anaerolineae bacterium]
MEKNSRKTLWIVLGVLAGLLLICVLCGIAGTMGYLFGRSAGRAGTYEYGGAVPRIERAPEFAPPERDFPMPMELQGGALIIEVTPDSPADDAGLLPGDIIMAVGGSSLDEAGPLADIVAGRQPGDALSFDVLRDGSVQTVEVTVGSDPENEGQPWLGLRYRDLPRFEGTD